MFHALQEMFRDQPHLAFITLVVCLLSFSGLAYLVGNYLLHRGRRSVEAEVPSAPVSPENVWTKPVVEEHLPRRRPVAGQPRHWRPQRQVVIVRVENSTPREAVMEK